MKVGDELLKEFRVVVPVSLRLHYPRQAVKMYELGVVDAASFPEACTQIVAMLREAADQLEAPDEGS